MSWSYIPKNFPEPAEGRVCPGDLHWLHPRRPYACTLDLIHETKARYPDMIWTRLACRKRMIISDYEFGQFCISICVILKPKEIDMAKGQQRSNREAKKPKKKKIKVIAAAPSQKGAGWQPTFAEGKRK